MRKRTFRTLYTIGFLSSWITISGWMYADFQGNVPSSQMKREDSGMSVVLGAFAAIVFPITIPMVYGLTGFAQYGWENPLEGIK